MYMNSRFRYITQILILFTLVLGTLFFLVSSVPCKQVITYRLGNVDVRFGLTEEDLTKALARAEMPWEELAKRELLRYAPDGDVVINFVYDERQERTQEEIKLDELGAKTEQQQQALDATYDSLKEDYTSKKEQYESLVKDYETRLEKYNNQVERFNREGNATQDDVDKLKKEADSLRDKETTIERERSVLNTLASRLNSTASAEEKAVTEYNSEVQSFSERFAGEGVFDQGEYGGQELNIYQYKTPEDLALVLAHEFGHTLGLDHVENESSLMYYLMGGQPKSKVTLSEEDKQAFEEYCGHPFSLSPASILEALSFTQERLSLLFLVETQTDPSIEFLDK
jgi:Matrixin